jgi:DnaJ-class molecular chaperone
VVCFDCEGTGAQDGEALIECKQCQGSGTMHTITVCDVVKRAFFRSFKNPTQKEIKVGVGVSDLQNVQW